MTPTRRPLTQDALSLPAAHARTAASASPSGSAPTDPADHAPRVLESQALFGAEEAVYIRHDGALYRLQRTRLGKLILTK
jgi:hemin uptake protein HemP